MTKQKSKRAKPLKLGERFTIPRHGVPPWKATLPEVVDALGRVRAQLSDLSNQKELLNAILIKRGLPEYDGVHYRATVSTFGKNQLDLDAAKKKLGTAWIKRHIKTVEQTKVCVVARLPS